MVQLARATCVHTLTVGLIKLDQTRQAASVGRAITSAWHAADFLVGMQHYPFMPR